MTQHVCISLQLHLMVCSNITTGAQRRTIVITGKPAWTAIPKPDFIASIVYGGPLEEIRCVASVPYAPGCGAYVTFIHARQAAKYYDATPNGVIYRLIAGVHPSQSNKNVAETFMCDDTTPQSSVVRDYVARGFTRCVRATGVDIGMSLAILRVIAGGKNNAQGVPPRRVENVIDDINVAGVSLWVSPLFHAYPLMELQHRIVDFRFCDIRHAVQFKAEISRMWEFEECNIQYTLDPCGVAECARLEIAPTVNAF